MVDFHGKAGPQHSLYGISHEHIVDRLTKSNWRTKAVVRTQDQGWLYLWLQRGYRTDGEKRQYRYFVEVRAASPEQKKYATSYGRLERALACVNGYDEGLLARETTPANTEDYPPERPALTLIIPWSFRRQEANDA